MSDIPLVDSSARLVEGSTTPGLVTAENLILDALLKVVHKDSRGDYKLNADLCGGSEYTPADVLAKLKTVDGPGSGLDADTVSGFGIGVECANVLTTFSQVLKGGKYVADSISGLPEAGYYTLDVIASPVFDAVWAFNISNAKLFVGARTHGTGAILWRQIFNSSVGSATGTDGNGGQPPAPKLHRATNTIPGFFQVYGWGVGETAQIPGWGGQVAWFAIAGTSIGTSGMQGVGASGAILGVQSGSTGYAMFIKIAG